MYVLDRLRPEKLSWTGSIQQEFSFIPVGGKSAAPLAPQQTRPAHSPPAVAVYSITGGMPAIAKPADVIAAVRRASPQLGRCG